MFDWAIIMRASDLPGWVIDFLLETTWCSCNSGTWLWAHSLDRGYKAEADWDSEDVLAQRAFDWIKEKLHYENALSMTTPCNPMYLRVADVIIVW